MRPLTRETVLQMPKVHLQASDLNPLARWQLQFFDGDQKLVHRIDDEGEPSDTVVWNNWKQSDDVQKATYRCVLTVHDIAGNRSTGEASFSTIRVDREDLDNRENKVVATSNEEKQVEVEVFSHTAKIHPNGRLIPRSKECRVTCRLIGSVGIACENSSH